MWQDAQVWENNWWGNCVNTFGEQEKQILYAEKMGLERFHNGKSPYNFRTDGRSVIDIGGGPTSLLLKTVDLDYATVVDPLIMPKWVAGRYQAANIELIQCAGEDFIFAGFEEAWLYNVLQHTANPELVIKNAQKSALIIRIFEWIETPTNIGHLHTLTAEKLDTWLLGHGKTENVNSHNCKGLAYYGIFPT